MILRMFMFASNMGLGENPPKMAISRTVLISSCLHKERRRHWLIARVQSSSKKSL